MGGFYAEFSKDKTALKSPPPKKNAEKTTANSASKRYRICQ